MSEQLSRAELREIRAYLERLVVGVGQVDRFCHLMDRLKENITSKPEKKSA